MITAEKISQVTALDTAAVARVLRRSGYPDPIRTARFLGLTTGGEFCYQISYWDTHEGREMLGKVWLSYNGAGLLEADY